MNAEQWQSYECVAECAYRDFFTHEGGRNTVEFFKETQSGDGVFIALKFESRSVAKDVLNRLLILLFACFSMFLAKFLVHTLISWK